MNARRSLLALWCKLALLGALAGAVTIAVVPARRKTAIPHAAPLALAAPPAPQPDLRRGLVGQWRFDDPAGSPSVRDSSGHGNDCRLRDLDAAGAFVAGVHGQALRLAPHGWLSCPQPRLAASAGEITVAAWVKKGQGRQSATALVAGTSGATGAPSFSFGFEGGRLQARGTDGALVSAPLPAYQRWIHVAFRQRGPEARLFIDGVEIARGPALLAGGGAGLTVGAAVFERPPQIRQRLDAAIDDLALYDRALTDPELAALARR